MWQRLLSFALSAILVLSLLPIAPAVRAEDAVPASVAGESTYRFSSDGDLKLSCVYVPPYALARAPAGGDETQDDDDWASQTMPTYTVADMDALLEKHKELLKEHESPFALVIQVEWPADQLQSQFNAFVNDTVDQTLAYSNLHTGIPDEGDYIKYQTGTRNYSASAAYVDQNGDNYVLNVTLKFKTEYYTTAEQEQAVTERLGVVMDGLNLTGKSTYEKIKTIHDYIVRNVKYDYEHLGNESYRTQYTAYGALIDGTSVCQGYAVLFYRMCLEAGVDARVISGVALTSDGDEPHAWNIAKIEDLYYYVDATWDDPTVEGGDPDKVYYDYFLIGKTKMAADHACNAEFLSEAFVTAYPISDDDYEKSYYDDYSDDEPSFVKRNLALEGQLAENVFMKLPEIAGCDYSEGYIEFIINGDTENPEIDNFDKNDRSEDGRLFKFTVHISSIQMADPVKAVFHYYVNGTEFTKEVTFTVEEYLDHIVGDNPSPELFELTEAIRNYGYYAQNYLSKYAKKTWTYGVDHKAMTMPEGSVATYSYTKNELEGYAAQKDLTADIGSMSLSLTLDTDTAINLFVNTASGYSGTVTAFIESGSGETPLTAVKVSGNKYKITIPGIAAHQLGDVFNVVIETAEGSSTVDVSALSYAYVCMEDGKYAKDVMSALYNYYLAAQNYKTAQS
jgi:transglutaminase-like putative cysteine protease